MAWKFGMGFFGGYYFGPGIFWVLIITPIRSSLSVEIRSTPTPGRNAPNNVKARNGLVNLQPRRCYGRQATLLPRIGERIVTALREHGTLALVRFCLPRRPSLRTLQ